MVSFHNWTNCRIYDLNREYRANQISRNSMSSIWYLTICIRKKIRYTCNYRLCEVSSSGEAASESLNRSIVKITGMKNFRNMFIFSQLILQSMKDTRSYLDGLLKQKLEMISSDAYLHLPFFMHLFRHKLERRVLRNYNIYNHAELYAKVKHIENTGFCAADSKTALPLFFEKNFEDSTLQLSRQRVPTYRQTRYIKHACVITISVSSLFRTKLVLYKLFKKS